MGGFVGRAIEVCCSGLLSKVCIVRGIVVSLSLLASLVLVGTARADLSQADVSALTATLRLECQHPVTDSSRALGAGASVGFSELSVGPSMLLLPTTGDVLTGPTRSDTLVIDGPPSSLGLFLSGLLTIGAWHIGRSAANWHPHLGMMPEWYHTGGPVQIGAAVPFDFHAGLAVVCENDSLLPVAVGPCGFPDAVEVDRDPGLLHLVSDPVRGPPL
jgi:hypothetical protein